MRMWMIDPKLMCNQHLLGEHVECHMFLGSAKKGNSMLGYVNHNCLEWSSLLQRHEDLVHEMLSRGMNHKSFIYSNEYAMATDNLPAFVRNSKVDVKQSQEDLFSRCIACNERFLSQ